MRKITEQDLKEIYKLNENGMKISEIAKKFGVNYSTIHYYLNREKRLKQIKDYIKRMPLEKRREMYRRKIPYIKEWLKKKYHSDPVFRKKQIERAKRYKKCKGKK